MKNKIYISIFAFILGFTPAIAQIEIDNKITFTGLTPPDNTIEGIDSTLNSTSILKLEFLQNNKLIYAANIGGSDSINLLLTPPISQYKPGTQVIFKANSKNSSSVHLNINGLGYIELIKEGKYPLTGGNLESGLLVYAIYDGVNFQLISETAKSCPTGFISVNDKYCIEINERPASLFHLAAINCGNINAHICDWAEWHFACRNTNLNLQNMTGNWEWINSGAVNQISAKVVGQSDCFLSSSRSARPADNIQLNYRCCYKK
jgi:hypothetical protein